MIRRYTYEVTFNIDSSTLTTQPNFEAKRVELEEHIAKIWEQVFMAGAAPNRTKPMQVEIHPGPEADV